MKKPYSYALIILLVGAILGGCVSEEEKETIAQTAQDNETVSTLVDLLNRAGLTETLDGTEPFTVFAPTNDAFAALPEELLETLGSDTEMLSDVLLYHVVSGSLDSTEVASRAALESVQGEEITVTVNGTVMVNASTVTSADIECSNGYIHIIDIVMLPPSVQVIPIPIPGPE